MKKLLFVMGALCFFIAGAQAWGLQGGSFRCHSTQGTIWRGTATIIEEQYHITVYADYLDVELDWVLQTGGTAPDSCRDALEIVGNVNLAEKSSVVGLLTWYQGMTLKGKLKTKDAARDQYEDVVQRDFVVPPIPRDPVLIEKTRGDSYDISIFPVSFNGSRKIRIRYLVPAFSVNGVNKIAYPNALTNRARVFIKKGSGVKGYALETGTTGVCFENRDYAALSNTDYSFQAYAAGKQWISYITPVLPADQPGSKFYLGDVSAPALDGQMAHVTTMSGEEALRSLGLPEDFVILWRWNHPQVLAKYARQIVEQSGLLQEFLAGLESVGQRAALVIDKEGGERIIFTLDKKGSAEYDRMVAYLAELGKLTVVEPPWLSTPRTGNVPFDVNQTFAEFKAALQAAMEQFDQSSSALKHLLILTAGPKLVSGYAADQTIDWDESINVSLLESFMRSRGKSGADLGSSGYWPGVDLGRFLLTYKAGLSVYATVGNGTDTNSIQVLAAPQDNSAYCLRTGTTQMHLYSDRPLQREITWSIFLGGRMLAGFVERPQVVLMHDGMQYARVIGASPHLVPLAQQMPSSMASSLGFIDKKYSLVALEEDALPAKEAGLYVDRGVPLLSPGDIFPAADERTDLPVADWLTANPPEPMNELLCRIYLIRREIMIDDMIGPIFTTWNMATTTGTPVTLEPVSGAIVARLAPALYSPDPEAYIDYESALDVTPAVQPTTANAGQPIWYINNERLTIDLAVFDRSTRERMQVVLYDLSGRVVVKWSGAQLAAQTRLMVPIGHQGLARGAYIMHVYGAGVLLTKRLIVW